MGYRRMYGGLDFYGGRVQGLVFFLLCFEVYFYLWYGTVCGQVKMGKAFITCFFNFISQGKRVMEN